MRFYLDVPLVLGFVLMATSACLGMLQLAAARGGYRGLSLFATDQKRGVRIGIGLTVISVLTYLLFAPEIYTPGPAGSEVAVMFGSCALLALGVTILGADLRLRRNEFRFDGHGEWLATEDVPVMLYQSSPTPPYPGQKNVPRMPAILVIPDPSGFSVTPKAMVENLGDAGLAVFILDTRILTRNGGPANRQTTFGHVSSAIAEIAKQKYVDKKRLGLLGIGGGADLTLQATSKTRRVRAAMAVCPVALAPLKPGLTSPGLSWLRDLSYRQAWNWRRRGAPHIYNAQETALEQNWKFPALAEKESVARPPVLTTRSSSRAVELFSVPSDKFFALLDHAPTRRLIVQWFRETLLDNG
jgi:dienelactone hydrolase